MDDVYCTIDGGRWFIVPCTVELADGDLAIQRLDGTTRAATERVLAPFEVDRATARARAKDGLRPAVEAAFELVRAAAGGTGSAASAPAGVKGNELERWLAGLERALETTFARAGAEAEAAKAREALAGLRSLASSRGARDAELGALAALCRSITGTLESSEAGSDLEVMAKTLEARARELGVAPDEAARERAQLDEMRGIARRSIAASLEEHGIQPLASVDPDPNTDDGERRDEDGARTGHAK